MSSNNLKEPKNLVRITHFINPHMFWYQLERSLIQNKEFHKLQREIDDYYYVEQTNNNQKYKPTIGEVVGVFIASWQRWIRARADKIIEYNYQDDKIILWAIDHGIPFEVTEKYIRPLPAHLAALKVNAVYFGGINNIVPSEKRYDFHKGLPEIKMEKNWSKAAVNQLENLIQESAEIIFTPEYDYYNHLFGSLEFVTFVNTKFNLGEVLINIGQAMKSSQFLTDLKEIDSINIPWYNDNDNNLPISIMKASKLSSKMLELAEPKFENNERVSEVVVDWVNRNKCLNDIEDNFNDIEDNFNDIKDKFNDLDFQDSVSVMIEPNDNSNNPTNFVNELCYTGISDINVRKFCETVKTPLRSEVASIRGSGSANLSNSTPKKQFIQKKLPHGKLIPAGFDLSTLQPKKGQGNFSKIN